ncbi:glycosyltransferase family 4 protein [Fusobacterium perfoetens]|uniref:glycosyltransferase family 4 protein n=1 Tax=Fusobacterium perfoetens TaxID=852 RepID=UPI001F18311C|nr:glycosyltransferase family 4 protein [Fusobacterium perfoetens]MCF2625384.1 glycosyltransferase family 4 protein [Fusobacterium perfoetens]
MKKIWVMAPFTEIENIKNRNRFQYIANELSKNYEIHLFTSDFIHIKKEFCDKSVENKYSYNVHLIHETGYKKNISVKRAISHITFALNLKKKIKKMEKPDLIYCAYPMMTSAFFMGKYAEKNNIPFVLDIQDTWPESISAGINTDNYIVKILMYPFTLYANAIYRMADLMIGVSKTYVERGRVKNSKAKEFIPVYIGAEGNKFDNVKFKKINDEIWITYIGTLSHSYDIMTAILAFDMLKENKNIKLYILGDGPEFLKLKDKAEELGLLDKTIFFKGMLPYEDMIDYLKNSDIALNAIRGKALQTITNKFGDYVSAGLPILNCCQSKEVLNLIENRKLGLNYIPENSESLKEKILEILKDKERLEEYSKNCKKFAEEKFDRKKSYKIIFEKIKKILGEK